MGNKHRDSLGFWHDKEKGSNNPWIYTAIGKILGHYVPTKMRLYDTIIDCFGNSDTWWISRRKDILMPPISRDELIGMESLTNSDWLYESLVRNGFNTSNYGHKSKVVAIGILWAIRKEHRNYAWENGLVNSYPILFQLAPHDIYYFHARHDSFKKWAYLPFFWIYIVSTLIQSNISAKNILMVQLSDLGWFGTLRLMDVNSNILKYFGEEHPFNKCKYLINRNEV